MEGKHEVLFKNKSNHVYVIVLYCKEYLCKKVTMINKISKIVPANNCIHLEKKYFVQKKLKMVLLLVKICFIFTSFVLTKEF